MDHIVESEFEIFEKSNVFLFFIQSITTCNKIIILIYEDYLREELLIRDRQICITSMNYTVCYC